MTILHKFSEGFGSVPGDLNAEQYWLTAGGIDQGSIVGRTAAEKAAAKKAISGRGIELQSAIEKKLGRPLTPDEAMRGLRHHELRDTRQQLGDQARWGGIRATKKRNAGQNCRRKSPILSCEHRRTPARTGESCRSQRL